jgi:hypothetical protein
MGMPRAVRWPSSWWYMSRALRMALRVFLARVCFDACVFGVCVLCVSGGWLLSNGKREKVESVFKSSPQLRSRAHTSD